MVEVLNQYGRTVVAAMLAILLWRNFLCGAPESAYLTRNMDKVWDRQHVNILKSMQAETAFARYWENR